MVNNRGFIIHKLRYEKGCRHDYDVFKEDHPSNPEKVVNVRCCITSSPQIIFIHFIQFF